MRSIIKKNDSFNSEIESNIEKIREELLLEFDRISKIEVKLLYGEEVISSCQKIDRLNTELTYLIVQWTLQKRYFEE